MQSRSTLPFRPSDAPSLLKLDIPGWERLLTQGRLHGLAGRWYGQLQAAGMLEEIPPRILRHLYSEHLIGLERTRMARWEADRLAHAFRDSHVPVVLLKGAAYILAGLPPGQARMLSDVDILVPRADLPEAEAILNRHGWQFGPHSDYDEHYYREWMHELPPMQHVSRGSQLDVHHTLAPPTTRLSLSPAGLFERALPVPGSRLRILAPVDMALHSVLHGFYTGEFTNGWRDLLDIHELVSHFSPIEPTFWDKLLTRATEWGATRPLYYALWLANCVLQTPVPPAVLAKLDRHAPPSKGLMQWAFLSTVLPELPPSPAQQIALFLLYLRSHWLKMPPFLLAKHLWTKFRMRRMTSLETQA